MNLKHFFYKGYYENFQWEWMWFSHEDDKSEAAKEAENRVKKANDKLINFSLKKENPYCFTPETFPGYPLKQFELRTLYPGLLSGTGYMHETGLKQEIKIGFYFDHSTGLPVLPGHSVKGVLRSVFPGSKNDELSQARAGYILCLLTDLLTQEGKQESADSLQEKDIAWVRKLEKNIFEGDAFQSKLGGKNPKIRDVFLDAMIFKADENNKIIGFDFITPHGRELWKNPVPLPFIKVLPGVHWQFSFFLDDIEIDGISISAETKKKLFKKILLEQGAGAKTNVGYGRFEEVAEP